MNAIVPVFVITALWDVVLRLMATGYLHMLGVERMRWVRVLRPYFARHTLLAAASIAGIVGAVTLPIIVATNPYPQSQLRSLLWVALISALVGQMMRYSGLFPHLKRYYYDTLGFAYSFTTDAFSGVVVAVTYHLLVARHLAVGKNGV